VHGSQIISALLSGVTVKQLSEGQPAVQSFSFGLPVVYAIWISVIIILYFPCRWFMKVKQRRKDWWLSYL